MKRHIENLQGRLLKEIYLRYSSRSGTSLNSFITDDLKEDDGDLQLTINIKKDLEELEARGLITWDAEPTEKKGGNFPESKKYKDLLGTTTEQKYQTLKDIYVEVKLTPDKGLDHAANYVSSRANLSNNYWIRILTVGLLLVTAIGVIVQMRQCSISKGQQSQQPMQCDTTSPNGHSIQTDEPKTKTGNEIKDSSTKTKLKDTTALKQNTVNKKKKHKQ